MGHVINDMFENLGCREEGLSMSCCRITMYNYSVDSVLVMLTA